MKVNFFATFRQLTLEKSTEDFSAENLFNLLNALCRHYGSKFRDEIFDHGSLNKNVLILVNGKAIEHLAGLETRLNPEDEIAIFPKIAGG